MWGSWGTEPNMEHFASAGRGQSNREGKMGIRRGDAGVQVPAPLRPRLPRGLGPGLEAAAPASLWGLCR